MTTLQVTPTNWWSYNAKVSDGSRPVADIAMGWWRETGELVIDGVTWRARREGALSGAFVLEGPSGEFARAEKPSAFRRAFVIRHAGREYTLRPRSMWKRAFVLLQGEREIGSVAPKTAFSRKAETDLPDSLPLPVRLFIVWLTMISWRRDDAAAASGSGGS